MRSLAMLLLTTAMLGQTSDPAWLTLCKKNGSCTLDFSYLSSQGKQQAAQNKDNVVCPKAANFDECRALLAAARNDPDYLDWRATLKEGSLVYQGTTVEGDADGKQKSAPDSVMQCYDPVRVSTNPADCVVPKPEDMPSLEDWCKTHSCFTAFPEDVNNKITLAMPEGPIVLVRLVDDGTGKSVVVNGRTATAVLLPDAEYKHLQDLRQAVADEERRLAVKYGASEESMTLCTDDGERFCAVVPDRYEFHGQFLLIDKKEK